VRRGAFPTSDTFGMTPISTRFAAHVPAWLIGSAIARPHFAFTIVSEEAAATIDDDHHGYRLGALASGHRLGKLPTVPTHTQSGAISGNLLRGCLIGALICGIAGCAAPVPKLAQPLPAQWQHAVASDPAKPTDLHGWWHAFGDPELDALVDRALANNLDVAQAVERMRAVRAVQRSALTHYLPSLRASTSDVVEPSAHASYQLAGFDASWEFGLFGRAEGSRREARGALDASIADLRTAQVSLVAEVVREWIELRTAQQQEQLLSQINEARQHECELLQVRQHLQLVAPSAVDQAQAALRNPWPPWQPPDKPSAPVPSSWPCCSARISPTQPGRSRAHHPSWAHGGSTVPRRTWCARARRLPLPKRMYFRPPAHWPWLTPINFQGSALAVRSTGRSTSSTTKSMAPPPIQSSQ